MENEADETEQMSERKREGSLRQESLDSPHRLTSRGQEPSPPCREALLKVDGVGVRGVRGA